MKKIIYSLVIMIAAGSLFTSCIEQVEPLGIQDLRYAKAEYIRALKDLRAADAEFRRAEAQLKLAEARYQDAETARVMAEVEMQELLNEYQALVNQDYAGEVAYNEAERQARLEELEMLMEELRAEHEKNMVEAAEELARAEEQLRVTLRNIALAAQSLTSDEKEAVAYAVAAYELAFEAVQKQKVEVMKAQHRVDTLKWIKANQTNKAWDSETHSYQYKVDIWKRNMNRAQAAADFYKAVQASIPTVDDFADLQEWNATLQMMADYRDAVEYSKHELAEEVTAYYLAYVYDGWEAYNKAVAQWEYDNPEVDDPGKAPAYTEGQTSYTTKYKVKVDGKTYAAGTTVGAGSTDVIELPALEMKTTAAYTKLAALLDSYTAVKEPTTDKAVMTIGTDELTINASAAMKSFIMGTEKGDVDTQVYNYKDKDGNKQKLVASYGLEGAFAALKRDKVIKDEEAIDPDKAKAAMEAAQKLWESDLDTLTKGIAVYKPYTDALAEYAEAVNSETNGAAAMVQAVKDLKKELDKVNAVADKKSFTYNDSLAVFNALKAFATAREQYLDYSAVDAKGKKKATDSTYFKFATGKTGGKVTVDSVKFSAMTFADLAAHKYDYKASDATAFVGGASITDVCPCNTESGLAHIADQLLGSNVAAKLSAYPTTTKSVTKDDLNNGNAFYKTYKIDDYEKPTAILNADDTPYEPAAIAAAETKVKNAVGKFINVYNRFWAENLAKDIADAEYDDYFAAADKDKAKKLAAAEKKVTDNMKKKVAYSLKTFNEPYFLVAFDGTDILFTNAMGIVLGSVDPNKTGDAKGANFNTSGKVNSTSAVFYGPNTADFAGKTDFYNYAKAVDTYNKSLEPFSTSLQEIREWIDDVDATFGETAEEDAALVKKVFQADSAAWAAKKAAYDKYAKALETFVGGKAKDGYQIVYCNYYGDPNEFFDGNWFWFNLAGVDIFGDFDGKWADDKDIDGFVLGGEQLKLAEKFFPGLPEKLLEWSTELKTLNEEADKAQIAYDALEKAYVKAAKAAGYIDDDTMSFDEVLEEVEETLDGLYDVYGAIVTYYEGQVDKNAKNIADFYNEVPLIDIEIADAQADLAIEQHRLAALEKALAYAKENLDRIIEYLKSLDVNFIVITGDDAAAAAAAAGTIL